MNFWTKEVPLPLVTERLAQLLDCSCIGWTMEPPPPEAKADEDYPDVFDVCTPSGEGFGSRPQRLVKRYIGNAEIGWQIFVPNGLETTP